MYVVYEGPHLEVEVPHDEVAGGLYYAERGKAIDVLDVVAESLLSQGENSDPDGEHQRTWRKASSKEVVAAQKAADKESFQDAPELAPAASETKHEGR